MPVINFKKQFAALVKSGQKRQTIRRTRLRNWPIKAGDRLYIYTGLGRKGARKLGEAVCSSAKPIEICAVLGLRENYITTIRVGGKQLENKGKDALAKADGFRSFQDFETFFLPEMICDTPLTDMRSDIAYSGSFCGQLIKWEALRRTIAGEEA